MRRDVVVSANWGARSLAGSSVTNSHPPLAKNAGDGKATLVLYSKPSDDASNSWRNAKAKESVKTRGVAMRPYGPVSQRQA